MGQRYFDGEEVLFSDLVRILAELIECMEELVTMFNNEVATNPKDKMNPEAIRHDTGKRVTQEISYQVDMAKAETLDALGEPEAGTELVWRYL